MSKVSRPPETAGKVMRCLESSQGWPEPDWLCTLTDHCGALTKTELPATPLTIVSGWPGRETTKRWANAAFLDLAVTVHAPCIVIAIKVSPVIEEFAGTAGDQSLGV